MDVQKDHYEYLKNVTLKKYKCVYKMYEFEFLGQKLSTDGIRAEEKKVKNNQEFRAPSAIDEELNFFLN